MNVRPGPAIERVIRDRTLRFLLISARLSSASAPVMIIRSAPMLTGFLRGAFTPSRAAGPPDPVPPVHTIRMNVGSVRIAAPAPKRELALIWTYLRGGQENAGVTYRAYFSLTTSRTKPDPEVKIDSDGCGVFA